MNGFLNAGNPTNLLLAVGGCPGGPLVAGAMLILHFAPVAVCLTGANVTVGLLFGSAGLAAQSWGLCGRGSPALLER